MGIVELITSLSLGICGVGVIGALATLTHAPFCTVSFKLHLGALAGTGIAVMTALSIEQSASVVFEALEHTRTEMSSLVVPVPKAAPIRSPVLDTMAVALTIFQDPVASMEDLYCNMDLGPKYLPKIVIKCGEPSAVITLGRSPVVDGRIVADALF